MGCRIRQARFETQGRHEVAGDRLCTCRNYLVEILDERTFTLLEIQAYGGEEPTFSHLRQSDEFANGVPISRPVLEDGHKIRLERSKAERPLLPTASWLHREDQTDLIQQRSLVPLLTELPEDGMQAEKRRLIVWSLFQSAHRIVPLDCEVVKEHRLFRGEMAKHSAPIDASCARNLIDCGFLEALIHEQSEGRRRDATTRLSSLAITNRSLGHAA